MFYKFLKLGRYFLPFIFYKRIKVRGKLSIIPRWFASNEIKRASKDADEIANSVNW